MVILRGTKKVLRYLPISPVAPESSDTALGDWYCTRLVVDRQPLLLFVSSVSLMAFLEPARNLKDLPERFPELVWRRLRYLPLPQYVIECEVKAMDKVYVRATLDRSIVGTMVEFAKSVPYYIPEGVWSSADFPMVEHKLMRTPCRASKRGRTIFPDRETPRVLLAKWAPTDPGPAG